MNHNQLLLQGDCQMLEEDLQLYLPKQNGLNKSQITAKQKL